MIAVARAPDGFSSTSVWKETWMEVHRISSWNFNSSEMLNLGPSRSPVPSTPAGPSQSPDSHRQPKLARFARFVCITLACIAAGLVMLHSPKQRKEVSSKKRADQSSEHRGRTNNFKDVCGRRSVVQPDFDVFLNHHGPDSKKGFVSHLGESLRSVGLKPFLDKDSLTQGSLARQLIYYALQAVKVHVAVLSKGYANSSYCLDELVIMTGSGKPIVPVFYEVEPGDLRDLESGVYGEAFQKHMRDETPEQVEEWANALKNLAGIVGIQFRRADINGDEATLKWEVVAAVTKIINASQTNIPTLG